MGARRVLRVLIVPRWGGRPYDDFYPWLVDRIAAGEVPGAGSVEALDLLEAENPPVALWTRLVAAKILEAPSETVVVGHSVGAQAALRAVATLPEGTVVPGILAVAAWRTVDEPWPAIREWIDTPIDAAAVRRGARRIRALVSDDDPFTRDHGATAAWLREAFGAEVTVVHGAKHFNGQIEADVMAGLVALF
jgi:uncharacterized protein